jgi:hypothetical protein
MKCICPVPFAGNVALCWLCLLGNVFGVGTPWGWVYPRLLRLLGLLCLLLWVAAAAAAAVGSGEIGGLNHSVMTEGTSVGGFGSW